MQVGMGYYLRSVLGTYVPGLPLPFQISRHSGNQLAGPSIGTILTPCTAFKLSKRGEGPEVA